MLSLNKRVFLPAFAAFAAIALIFGTSAFKSPEESSISKERHKSAFSYTFYFTGNPLLSGEVENESKWSLTPPANAECGSTQNKACMIVVDDNQTEVVDGVRVLKNTLNIIALAGASGSGSGYIPKYPHTGISATDNKP